MNPKFLVSRVLCTGVIEFEEFVEMMGDYEVIGEEEIISAFKMFDRNGDGVISKSELK